ncbi:hypothetical protein BDV41DRAFT_288883 [Aspergillus transmontanensis]|uniref:Uncharacterized protein n=1 Tax=Aspergillus transmontanensis TaxID=1034304 RepID=A0A5N6WE37_9EURO|nr:hypothetical protein BDV41DRAFT_288883 [Aspergillus transmontanensis]
MSISFSSTRMVGMDLDLRWYIDMYTRLHSDKMGFRTSRVLVCTIKYIRANQIRFSCDPSIMIKIDSDNNVTMILITLICQEICRYWTLETVIQHQADSSHSTPVIGLRKGSFGPRPCISWTGLSQITSALGESDITALGMREAQRRSGQQSQLSLN